MAIDKPQAPTRYLSPLRYPGAKTKLTPFIAGLIESALETGRLRRPLTLVEPFAGGAAATLRLLTDQVVDHAVIGDADPLLASFWVEAARKPERLIERMTHEHETYVATGGTAAVDRWDYWRKWRPNPASTTDENRLGLAVKCLFLNRTTFSGILHGSAGPIGGRAQLSAYPIGCRFDVPGLAARIRWVGHLHSTGRLIEVRESGWRDTLETARTTVEDQRNIIAYLDPPYIAKSDRLYGVSFREAGLPPNIWRGIGPHQMLAEYLKTEASFRWILSYDHHPDLLGNVLLYGRRRVNPTTEAILNGAKRWVIENRTVRIQHSASVGSNRRDVPELLLSTLAAKDLDAAMDVLESPGTSNIKSKKCRKAQDIPQTRGR